MKVKAVRRPVRGWQQKRRPTREEQVAARVRRWHLRELAELEIPRLPRSDWACD